MKTKELKKKILYNIAIWLVVLLTIALSYYETRKQDQQTKDTRSENRSENVSKSIKQIRVGKAFDSSYKIINKVTSEVRRVKSKFNGETGRNNGEKEKGTGNEDKEITLGKGCAVVNLNPCNLIYTGRYIQAELQAVKNGSSTCGAFAKFKTKEDGLKACEWQVNQYRISEKAYTLESYVYRYAPPHENDTEGYIKFLSEKLNVSRNAKMIDIDLHDLVTQTAWKEGNSIIKY